MLGDYVTLEAGHRRRAHRAGHGADDYNTGVRYGLEIYAPLDPGGRFIETVELFAGLSRSSTRIRRSSRRSQKRGRLWHREDFEHSYPHCWRCHNPVIFLATSQWFIAMDAKRPARARARRRSTRRALDPVVGARRASTA